MKANLVNMLAIFLGCGLGSLVSQHLDKKLQDFLMTAMGLVVFFLGIQMSLETKNTLLVILSLVLGGALGTQLRIEDNLYRLGDRLEKKWTKSEKSNFASGFINASLLFCIGSMSIVGSLQAGLQGDYSILYAKAILDGTIALVLVNTLGPGVYGSLISVGIYQGAIVLFSRSIRSLLTGQALGDLTGLGGILIMAIGLNLLEIKKIKVGDMLPGLVLVVLYYLLIA